jgi:hypothetical protein
MPNIEIISLRFNLNRNNDRKLFEALQERADSGKRNEFLKQVLFDCIVEDSPEGNSAVRPSKKQARESKESHAVRGLSGVAETRRAAAPGPQASPKSATDATAGGPACGDVNHLESDAETAGLVSQFVQ